MSRAFLLGYENLSDLANHFLQLRRRHGTCAVQDDVCVSSKEAIGANVARLSQPTAGEIALRQRDGISVPDGLAGDLAEDEVIAGKRSDNQGRPFFGSAQVGEGERGDDYIAPRVNENLCVNGMIRVRCSFQETSRQTG